MKDLIDRYTKVFKEGLGIMQDIRATLSLKEGATPRFHRPRPVPFAIREAVGKELDHLEEAGTLRKVEHSEWAAPIVPVPKKDGAIRLCGDYKVTINPELNVDQYLLPNPSELLARFGLPEQLVSDNGPQFVSDEFKTFLEGNGVKHLRSAPYHPATNGAAERLVQTIKQALKAAHQQGMPLEKALPTFLLRYRITPHATTGAAPSTLFLGRTPRTRLNLLRSSVADHVFRQQS